MVSQAAPSRRSIERCSATPSRSSGASRRGSIRKWMNSGCAQPILPATRAIPTARCMRRASDGRERPPARLETEGPLVYDSRVPPAALPPEDPALTTVFGEGGRATVRHLRKSKLVILSGPDAGRELEVQKARVSGGRSMINDLVLSDKAVSGTHFEVISRDDGYRLRDLDSTNGTYVGDVRIKEVFLRPNTTFRVGHTDLKFSPTSEVVEIALSERDRFDRAIGGSLRMREIFAILEKVAPSDLTVLINGETGTGKEVIARGIHNNSPRKSKPFVVLDCSAIPRDLIESTLFGHEKGSFT